MLQNVFDLLQKANNRARDVLNAVITAAKVGKAALEAAIGLWNMIIRWLSKNNRLRTPDFETNQTKPANAIAFEYSPQARSPFAQTKETGFFR